MTRVIVIFTAVWFLALGTGAAERVHNAAHVREDAASQACGHSEQAPPVHNDSNCDLHAALHAPLSATPAVLVLIDAGLLVAFVSELPAPPVSVRVVRSIDCRGPPCLA